MVLPLISGQGSQSRTAADARTNSPDSVGILDLLQVPADAYQGLAGDFVRLVSPHTEADEAALLVSFLIGCGNFIGRYTHYLADGAKHFANEFAVVVGVSSKARKGTSWNRVKDVLALADPLYVEEQCTAGLSSGEGLIWAVRDGNQASQSIAGATNPFDNEDIPAGTDNRLLISEGEFGRAFKVMGRESNTLSAILREAWDGGSLNILTKNQPVSCTNAHISLIAHITVHELRRLLGSGDTSNGFANRFLWVWATRSKLLPFGGDLATEELRPIAERLRGAAKHSRDILRINFDPEARQLWASVYGDLSEAGDGLVGDITSRNEAHAVRLASLYALLDCSAYIRIQHLKAALAVVDYSTRSVQHIFGSELGGRTAEGVLRLLKTAAAAGLRMTDIHKAFGGNKQSSELKRALAVLESRKLAYSTVESTGGRSAERWFLNTPDQMVAAGPSEPMDRDGACDVNTRLTLSAAL
jgi:hypothetical protein